MPTNGDLIDDVLFTMGFTHDDAILHRAAVGYNLGIVINRLKTQRLQKDLRGPGGGRSTSNEITTYIVSIQREPTLRNRAYFDLPSGDILDINVNGGVGYLAYASGSGCKDSLVGKHFTLASPAEMDMLDGHGMQRPSPATPYYFRSRLSTPDGIITNRVWLYGPGPLVTDLEAGLYMTTADIQNLDPDAEVDLPPDMVYLAKRMLLDLGRWSLMIPGQRLKNDGRDFAPYNGPQPFQPPKEVSINDPVNITDSD